MAIIHRSDNPCVNARRHLIKEGEHKGEHDGTEAGDRSLLCRSCHRRLEQRIAELPALCSWLHANLARFGSAGQLVTGSREAPVPISLTVVALLEWPARICVVPDPVAVDRTPSIPAVLDSWIRLILEEDPQLVGPRKPTVDVMVLWLLARMSWLVEQRWVDELALEMDRLHAAINAAAPYWPMRDKPRPTPCPKCELRGLVWNSRWFECDSRLGGCGALLSQAEYDVLTQRWAVWAQDQEVAV